MEKVRYYPCFTEMGRLKNKEVETESKVVILIPKLSFHKTYEVNRKWKNSLSSDFKDVKSRTTLRLVINYNTLEGEGERCWN